MKNLRIATAVTFVLAVLVHAVRSESKPTVEWTTWESDDGSQLIKFARTSPLGSSQDVKNFAAGFVHGILGIKGCDVREADVTTLGQLPGLIVRSTVSGDGQSLERTDIVAFAEDSTYIVTAVGVDPVSKETIDSHVNSEGTALAGATKATAEVARMTAEFLSEVKKRQAQ